MNLEIVFHIDHDAKKSLDNLVSSHFKVIYKEIGNTQREGLADNDQCAGETL